MEASSYEEFVTCFVEGCSRCTLHMHEGNKPVLYRGNPDAKILLFGEGPGLVEQQELKPFVGPAGEKLDQIFNAIDISTDTDMIIKNIVCCRPTAAPDSGRQNYTPKKDQIVRCWQFGKKAIDLLDPKIIIACGRPALQTLIDDPRATMGANAGRWLPYPDDRKLFVMHHPAAILHKSNWPDEQRQLRKQIWEYMQHFRDTYQEKLAI
jgi:DNA polymerase